MVFYPIVEGLSHARPRANRVCFALKWEPRTMMRHLDYAHHMNDLKYISQGDMSKNNTKSKLYLVLSQHTPKLTLIINLSGFHGRHMTLLVSWPCLPASCPFGYAKQ